MLSTERAYRKEMLRQQGQIPVLPRSKTFAVGRSACAANPRSCRARASVFGAEGAILLAASESARNIFTWQG